MSDATRKLLESLINRPTPYDRVGQAISAFQYRPYKAGDEGTAIGVGIGQALASGILEGLGRRRRATQQNAVSSVLSDITRDPLGTARPEALDADIFEALRQDAILKQVARAEADALKQEDFARDLEKIAFGKEYDVKASLAEALLQDPRVRNKILTDPQAFGQMVSQITSGGGIESEPAAVSPEDVLAEVVSRRGAETDPIAAAFKTKPTEQLDPISEMVGKQQEIRDALIMATGDEDFANKVATEAVQPTQQSAAANLKKAQEIRSTALTLAATLSGVKEKLEDLPLQGFPAQGAIKAGARLFNFATGNNQDEVREYLSKRGNIDGLKSRVTSIFRTVGEGVITDADREAFLEGLPSTDASLPENIARYERLMNWLETQTAYADQLEMGATGRVTPFEALEVKTQTITPNKPMTRAEAMRRAEQLGIDLNAFTGMSRAEAIKKAKEIGKLP